MKRINKNKKLEIRDLSESISDLYFPDSIIEPDVVADKKGITYSYNNYNNIFDGLLEYENGEFHIYCNCPDGNKRNPRVRFTFAHELGHYFIDDHRNFLIGKQSYKHLSYTDTNSDSIAEQEADYFASCFLMPSNKLMNIKKTKENKIEEILMISSFFNTSITSSAIKYVEIDSAPLLIIKWNSDRSSWFAKSKGFENLSLGYLQTDFSQIVQNSATFQAFNDTSNKIHKTGTMANVWFPSVGNSISRNKLFIEEALSLGQYGVLTLLYPDTSL